MGRLEIPPSARVLFFDIECTNLKADFGTVLCIGYKWLGEKKTHVPSIMDYPNWQKDATDDSRLLKDFLKVWLAADVIVSYNGKRFDVPYLYAKLLEHGLEIPPNLPHIDLYFTVKSNLALSRKSLANVLKHLKLDTQKTPVTGNAWKRATTGHGPSIKYVIDHCKADVLVLEEAYLKLRPLVRMHPLMKGFGPCANCGSENLASRGHIITAKKKTRRIQCRDCGSWGQREI